MKFEVVNDKGKTVFTCSDISCVPKAADIKIMSAGGYKFRWEGKIVSVKRVVERLKGQEVGK